MTISKQIKFCAGHRLDGYKGKCSNFHGHNYVLEVFINSKILNDDGMVVDFSEIKNILGGWIEKNLDHSFIYSQNDKISRWIFDKRPEFKVFILPNTPTVENLSLFILEMCRKKLFSNRSYYVSKIKLYESDTTFAEVE